jgi:Ser/Thr protein kinase RdoA (MazF antagonist)
LGERLGSGGNNDVYAFSDDKVIGVLKDGKPISALENEIAYLRELEQRGLPTVKAEIVDLDGKPAIIRPLRSGFQGSGQDGER